MGSKIKIKLVNNWLCANGKCVGLPILLEVLVALFVAYFWLFQNVQSVARSNSFPQYDQYDLYEQQLHQ